MSDQGIACSLRYRHPSHQLAQPQNIPLDILYEDADVIVVNKARNMVVHPAAGNYDGTLVNALLGHCKGLSGINGGNKARYCPPVG